VLIGSLGLFWSKACVRESLDSFLLYLFCYVLILSLLARNAFIFVHLNSVVQKLVTCCPRECSWSLGPVGIVGQVRGVFS
jgi:hypothetical protein